MIAETCALQKQSSTMVPSSDQRRKERAGQGPKHMTWQITPVSRGLEPLFWLCSETWQLQGIFRRSIRSSCSSSFSYLNIWSSDRDRDARFASLISLVQGRVWFTSSGVLARLSLHARSASVGSELVTRGQYFESLCTSISLRSSWPLQLTQASFLRTDKGAAQSVSSVKNIRSWRFVIE